MGESLKRVELVDRLTVIQKTEVGSRKSEIRRHEAIGTSVFLFRVFFFFVFLSGISWLKDSTITTKSHETHETGKICFLFERKARVTRESEGEFLDLGQVK